MRKVFIIALLPLIIFILNTNSMSAQNTTTYLSASQQGLITVTALAAAGDMENLNIQIPAALDAGLSVSEIKEAFVQLYAYSGFPRSLNAIMALKAIVEQRSASGFKDAAGKADSPENNATDKYEQGRRVLETLTGTFQKKPAPGFGEFSARIDAYLKEHLFGDIFSSDILSFQQRELVTIAALAAMTGVAPQLKAHIGMGKNTGITENQLLEVAQLIEKHIGRRYANVMLGLLHKPAIPLLDADKMVRISAIEIVPQFKAEYLEILKEEASASMKKEPGVIAIFPMENPACENHIQIVEIYANKQAYEAHLQSPHFKYYKESTLKMVQSLRLIDQTAIDAETMADIFIKIK
jgi:alkylhydroperoxidase/carboxymuconolactone decarboxylase family protein YurZ/quinol monooxygenase YgiN